MTLNDLRKADWFTAWNANYEGISEAHKDLERFMKKNYKDHKYIPWATMVKWLYLMDENATLTVVKEGAYYDDSHSVVHTSSGSIEMKTDKGETKSTHAANFVVVQCTFKGRTFEEVYPIQDSAYNAPKHYDSNMVNKAIQRAKAKLISTATGLAFSLFEEGDLQWVDDDKKPATNDKPVNTIVEKKTEVVKPTPAPKPTPVAKPTTSAVSYDGVVGEAIAFIKSSPNIDEVFRAINPAVIKNYKFAFNGSDNEDVLADKLSKIKDVSIFLSTLKKRYEGLSK